MIGITFQAAYEGIYIPWDGWSDSVRINFAFTFSPFLYFVRRRKRRELLHIQWIQQNQGNFNRERLTVFRTIDIPLSSSIHVFNISAASENRLSQHLGSVFLYCKSKCTLLWARTNRPAWTFRRAFRRRNCRMWAFYTSEWRVDEAWFRRRPRSISEHWWPPPPRCPLERPSRR